MNHLDQVQLLDCSGKVTHTLTLLVDGTVAITFAAGHRAIVDPLARRCLTPGMHLEPTLLDAAGAMRPRR